MKNTAARQRSTIRLRRPAVELAILVLAVLVICACGCGAGEADDTGLANPTTPVGNWTASSTGSFSVLPAGTDRYTLVFRDSSRPRLALKTSGLSYTASGSQTNAAAREIVEYSLSGSFDLTTLNGTLRIVKRRTGSGTVFSTQTLPVQALKQRHDTASLAD